MAVKYSIILTSMKKVFVVDNYDSFTYNLVHYFEELDCAVTVKQNDQFDLDELELFETIVLSPGPGLPKDAGLLMEVILRYGSTKKILGVCLGLQAIVEVYGGTITNLDQVFHGVSTEVQINPNDPLFKNLPATIDVGRYHSWAAATPLPACLTVTAQDEAGITMAIRHKTFDICAVQFHPESIMTSHGKEILRNWLEQ
jgi:anthranilate synthase component II